MPFTITFDPEHGIAIMGLVSADEVDAFESQWLDAVRAQKNSRKETKPTGGRGIGNWHALFLTTTRRAAQFTPDVRMSDKPGFKHVAIKTWRTVAGGTFHEARDYVESLMRESQPYPQGNEYPDIPPEAMEELSGHYRRACDQMES